MHELSEGGMGGVSVQAKHVGDIQGIGNGSSTSQRVLVYVLKDVLFKVESSARLWSTTVSLASLEGTCFSQPLLKSDENGM